MAPKIPPSSAGVFLDIILSRIEPYLTVVLEYTFVSQHNYVLAGWIVIETDETLCFWLKRLQTRDMFNFLGWMCSSMGKC